MRNFILFSIFILAFFVTPNNDMFSQSEGDIDEEIKQKLKNARGQSVNTAGREFWIAFPMNAHLGRDQQVLGIYVTSMYDTEVTLRNDYLGVESTYNVNALGITEISSVGDNSPVSFNWEIKDYETPQNLGFSLTSPDPISVYVLSSKKYNSDGYLAIPEKFWGTRYIHNSFKDFGENEPWGGGFTILAKEDNTNITIKVKDGLNQLRGFGETTGGKQHGDEVNVTLMEGQVYAMRGNGETRGGFDISGTEITSNKPVGLLSFHSRTMLPSQNNICCREYLIEMMPPTKAWGKEYATVELARGTDYGDYFRVVASEPNTNYKIEWWDKRTNEKIKEINSTILEAGGWHEYYDKSIAAPHDFRSIRGVSRFTADKPILVMQYAYGFQFDNAEGRYDPFMFLITAKEQFTTQTVFQTPSNENNVDNPFRDNFFNIIAVGDPDDTERNQKLLESVTIDGKSVAALRPQFYGNRIPGTNLYWAFIDNLEQGRHEINAETPFGGYIYGFARVDSYGWPAATAYKDLAITDTLAPIVTYPEACNEWVLHNVDDPEHERNGQEGDDPQQIDQGVSLFPTLQPGSYNFYEPVYVDEEGNELGNDTWDPTPPNYDFYYKVGVIDPYQDALAVLHVEDEYGNVTDTTIKYSVDSLLLEPEEVHFGDIKVNTDENLTVELRSNSEDTLTIETIELKFGDVYEIDPEEEGPFELEPYGSRIIDLTYTPVQEYPEVQPHEMDIDTLMVTTGCVNWKWPIDGRGVEPKIIVGDFDFGPVLIDDEKYSTGTLEKGVRIENPGTDTLRVTGVEFVELPFSMPNANPTTGTIAFDEPVIIPPLAKNVITLGQEFENRDEFLLQFAPKSANNEFGVSQITVNYLSNADGPDSESIWKGTAISSGLTLLPESFPPTRVKAVSDVKYFVLENIPPKDPETGELDPDLGFNANIYLQKDLLTFPNDSEFSVDWDLGIEAYNSNDDLQNTYNEGGSVTLSPSGSENTILTTKLLIPVRYNPGKKTSLVSDSLTVTYKNQQEDEDQTVKAGTIGSAYIPEIDISNVKFSGNVVRDEGPHPDTETLFISNITDTLGWDVTIENIYLDPNAPNSDQFVFDPDPSTLDFPITLEKGSPLQFEVTFLGDNNAALGENIGRLIVESDVGDAETDFPTENRWGTESSGNYVYDAPDTVDGGMTRGEVSETGVEANGHDFERVMACDIETATATIINNNTDDPLVIEDIVPDEPNEGDVDAFEVLKQSVIGETLAADGGETEVEVQFVATESGTEFSADYRVIFEAVEGKDPQTAAFTLTGELYESTIAFSVPSYTEEDLLTPGDITGENGVAQFDISVEHLGEGSWDDSKITEVTFSVKHKTNWIDINTDFYEFSNITNGWILINHTENKVDIPNDEGEDEEWTIHTYTIGDPDGTEHISSDGNLIRLKFTYLLSDELSIEVPVEDISFGGRDACHTAIETVSEIESEFCIDDRRAIVIGTATEGPLAEPISPNPVKNGRINYEYLVPTTAHTTIKIENSEGKVVKVPYDGMAEHGIYESTINVSDLPSGTYFISLKHLGSEETQKFLIVK